MSQLTAYRAWRPFALGFLFLMVANGYDAYATDVLMSRGAEEANPFVLLMMRHGHSAYLGWKVALTGLGGTLLLGAALFAPQARARTLAAFAFWAIVAGFALLCAMHAYFIHALAG